MPDVERDRLEERYGFSPDRVLASRASSSTYVGTTDSGRRAVLKVLELAHARTWKAVELFEREADVLESLNHPGIPTYRRSFTRKHDHGVTLALLRDYVHGETLEARLEAVEPAPVFDDADLVAFFDEVLDILEYLHNLNPPVVHRDITPAHLVQDDEDSYHLVGFGSLQSVLPRTRGGSTFVGSRGYMPVEQMMGKAKPASDLYALGMTALSVRTGLRAADLRPPDQGLDVEEFADLPAGLERFIEELLARDPDRRPRDAGVARRRFDHRDRLDDEGLVERVAAEGPPERTRVAAIEEDGVAFELESAPLTRFQKGTTGVGIAAFGLIVFGGISLLYVLLFGVLFAWSATEWILVRLRNAVVRANREGVETNNSSRYRLGFGRVDWEEIDAISAHKTREWGGDYYSVDAEVEGEQIQLATFLTGPQARWVAERLERLQSEYANDRRDRPALESAD